MTRTKPTLFDARRVALVCLASCIQVASADAQDKDAAELFIANCARCHGETGDGDGTAELDRPARSFKDGGFSYGNTPEALFRTISIGIPGTPMPGFDTSMTEAERRLVAEYVVTLGPQVREVEVEETILVVDERPLVVRGLLPAIDPGAVAHPRGLLLGSVSGLTFEYRADDVRLLGVRQGAFVERKDWSGRGGSALQPLGKVVYLADGGLPEPLFGLLDASGAATALTAKLESTWVIAQDVGLVYRLQHEDATRVVRVRESVSAVGTSLGTGFRRHLSFFDAEADAALRIRMPATGERRDAFTLRTPNGGARDWTVYAHDDGTFECIGIIAPGDTPAEFALTADTETEVDYVVLVAPEWTDTIKLGLAEVSDR